jgi:hypothetical protein
MRGFRVVDAEGEMREGAVGFRKVTIKRDQYQTLDFRTKNEQNAYENSPSRRGLNLTVSVEQLRLRLDFFERSRAAYEQQAKRNGGKLKLHEWWRHNYLTSPYLAGAPDDRVAARFREVFINDIDLNGKGQIAHPPVTPLDNFTEKFTHLLEDFASRGGLHASTIEEARKPILRYFEHGDPIAIKMFDGYNAPSTPFLVKYGRREFLEPMLLEGRIRICPASFYNDVKFSDAIKDDEIHKLFFIPTYRERLRGVYHLNYQGRRIEFGDDDIILPVVVPDYFLFSLCDHIYYRMPTDFGADAALIIRDPGFFVQKLISSFLARWSDWRPVHGPVTYYDPYRDYSKIKIPEMSKQFGYAYQREVRIVLGAKIMPRVALQPEFLNVGSMIEYAELVTA